MTAPDENETAPAEPGADASSGLNWLKEIVTAVLAVAIVAATLFLLISTLLSVDERAVSAQEAANPALNSALQLAHQQAFEERQTVMSIAIGLVGVVTGYFFGRLPAEQRAQAAEQSATTQAAAAEAATSSRDAALATAGDAQNKLADVRATVERMAAAPATATLSGGGGTPPPSASDVELQALKARMGW